MPNSIACKVVNFHIVNICNSNVIKTYKQACREGWANAPTNDLQKAVMESVKSEKERGPVNAIEIPMPSKKK